MSASRSGVVAAVDLGASSGRVILGHFSEGTVRLEQVARFPNTPVYRSGRLHWNVDELFRNAADALAEASSQHDILSVGVDSWGVDYGLLRGDQLIGLPHHYRDQRTAAASDRVLKRIGAAELYRRTGVQHMPINTIAQLEDDREAGRLDDTDCVLLTPDLIGYWLAGARVTERTIASTTGLLGAVTREWDFELVDLLGYPRRIFSTLVDPGETIAPIRAGHGVSRGATLVAVGSHVTASAVVGIPAVSEEFAYISCGTWGLVGVELDEPIITEASQALAFTNEGGVDGRIRFQRNAMGLWILNESIRMWETEDGASVSLPELLAAAGDVAGPIPIFDANDAAFAAPGDMPDRISAWLVERGLPVPAGRAAMTRCILESVAQGFADAIRQVGEITGQSIPVIHIVGGGSQNVPLCRAVANRSGVRVLAGPVEATATGNTLVQGRAAGLINGGIDSLRASVAAVALPREFLPEPRTHA